MIIAIDLGNFNVKTSNMNIFNSMFTSEVQVSDLGEEILEFNSKKYYMQKGSWDKEYNKAAKDYMPNLLYGIYKSLENTGYNNINIDLRLGLPIEQIELKESIKEQLENKSFEFKVNEHPVSINIKRLGIVAEGFSSFYTLSDKQRSEDTLIIDIGGRTVNVVSLVNKKIKNKATLAFGMIDLYEIIRQGETKKGKKLNVEDIENLINTKKISDIDEAVKTFIKKIDNELKLNFADREYFKMWLTGGGALVLKDYLDGTEFSKAAIMDNPVFSNVRGNYNIGLAKWS